MIDPRRCAPTLHNALLPFQYHRACDFNAGEWKLIAWHHRKKHPPAAMPILTGDRSLVSCMRWKLLPKGDAYRQSFKIQWIFLKKHFVQIFCFREFGGSKKRVTSNLLNDIHIYIYIFPQSWKWFHQFFGGFPNSEFPFFRRMPRRSVSGHCLYCGRLIEWGNWEVKYWTKPTCKVTPDIYRASNGGFSSTCFFVWFCKQWDHG